MKKTTVFFLTMLICINPFLIKAKTNNVIFKHYVGELFGGGIVVSVWQEKGQEHGLIASLADLSGGARWTIKDKELIGKKAQSAINGQANTDAILSLGVDSLCAAFLCDKYTNDGFSDWYLPSSWEMNTIYNTALLINTVLESDNNPASTGLECIDNPFYWSSTEYYDANAFLQNFFIGTTYNDKKSTEYRVRAVRRF